MKTKTKVLAIVEIAVVLCSVFLVAIPAVAAGQNQEMQKASASEVITTASEDDYVLGIYGNANEDDTIDMGDVVYTKLAIFGKKPKTELCDAKYDGRINVLDVIQTKLIILGKEKEITFLDWGLRRPPEPVTVNKPVKRIVVLGHDSAEVLRALNAVDKTVGVDQGIKEETVFFPELSKLPSVGSRSGTDYEAILTLNPDVIMAFSEMKEEQKEKLPGITVFSLGIRHPVVFVESVGKLGYILDKKEEAEELLNWYEGWLNEIKSRTKGLSEDEKPRVFHWAFFQLGGGYKTAPKGRYPHEIGDIAGGKNIAEDLEGTWPTVDPEWVMGQNPEIIVAHAYIQYIRCGYAVDDPSEMAAAREDILNRPELANVAAVKNKRVYIIDFKNLEISGSATIIAIAYMAKWFHPHLFEDMDPKAIHQEYLTKFCGLDYDLDKHGVFVYPPLTS